MSDTDAVPTAVRDGVFLSYPNGYDNSFRHGLYFGHIAITSSRSTPATSVPWLIIPNVDYVEDKKAVQKQRLTVVAEAAGGTRHGVVVARDHARGRSRAGSKSRVAAEHRDARSILGAAKGDHVLANMVADDVAMLSAAVGQDVLDEIVPELVTGDYIWSARIEGVKSASGTYCQSTACVDDLGGLRRHAPNNDQGTRCRQSLSTSQSPWRRTDPYCNQ